MFSLLFSFDSASLRLTSACGAATTRPLGSHSNVLRLLRLTTLFRRGADGISVNVLHAAMKEALPRRLP